MRSSPESGSAVSERTRKIFEDLENLELLIADISKGMRGTENRMFRRQPP